MQFVLSEHAQKVATERSIQSDWIDRCMRSPAKVEADATDPTLQHHLVAIPENENRVLRVV